MHDSRALFSTFEKHLAAVVRLLEERDTVGDITERCGYALPPASWSLLEHLHARGTLRVSQIAACHGVDISSITPRLKSLESAGLISRGRDAADGRVHLIEISPAGAEALERVHTARSELLMGLIGDDVDPQQVADASAVLARVASHLDHGDPDAALEPHPTAPDRVAAGG